MNQEGLNYYKSLVSDNEVIEALMKESKARDGELEKARVRPNLTFFQRTVSNMVSSNKRITRKQEQIIAKEKEKNINYRPRKEPVRKKLPIQLIKEILSNKINFVKSSDDTESVRKKEEEKPLERKKKTPFQLMREILTNQVQFVKAEQTKRSNVVKTDPSSSSDTSDRSLSSTSRIKSNKSKEEMKFTKRKKRSTSDSDASIISLSDSSDSSISEVVSDVNDVIRISDSDSSDTSEKYRRKKRK